MELEDHLRNGSGNVPDQRGTRIHKQANGCDEGRQQCRQLGLAS